MSTLILKVFDSYKQARAQFVQQVASLAARAANVDCMVTAGVLDLLKPLLIDTVPSIQQGAAVALGRIAGHDEKLAELIVRKDILPLLLEGLDKQSKYYKRSVLFILRAISKHSPEMADVVIHAKGLDTMMLCLEDFDGGVREAATWGLGYIARHGTSQAQAVVDVGAVPLLVLCLQEPDLILKQAAASGLADIAKHTEDLATSVADAGAIPYLVKAMCNVDAKLKRQALTALGQIAKHSIELAELVVEAEVFPEALIHLSHPDADVKKSAATVVREVVKHTLELAQLVVNSGGVAALLEMICSTSGSLRLPAIMSLGYICGHNDQLSLAVIGGKGIMVLGQVMCEEDQDHVLAASVWTLGQCGKHTPEHANCISACNILPRVLQLYLCSDASEDLRCKSKCTLKQVLQMTLHIEALEGLLKESPPNILKYVLGQFCKILPNDARARRFFVSSGALRKVQEMEAEPGSTLMEYIGLISSCFPEEVIRFYSPGYPDSLLEAVEHYVPQIPPLLISSRCSSEGEASQNICQDQAQAV